MENLKTPFYTTTGEAKGSFEWPKSILSPSPSLRVLHEAIVAYQANRRAGTSATKTRGLVRGGGRKPWKQKGTGNARSGSIRSPLWRKGGIIFGPQPRSYRKGFSTEKKLIALQTAIFEKAQDSGLAVIEGFKTGQKKTRDAQELFAKTGLAGRLLLVLEKPADPAIRIIRNIKDVTCVCAQDVNALQVAASHRILFTQTAVDVLAKRFPKD